MSTEIYLSRLELRRMLLAELGLWTNANAAAQVIPQINVMIDSAALKVAEASRDWFNPLRRAALGINPGEDLLSYRYLAQAHAWAQAWPNDYIPRTYGTAVDTWQPPELLPLQIPRGGSITDVARLSSTGRGWETMRRRKPELIEDPTWQDTHVQAEALESGNDADTIDAAQGIVEQQRGTPQWYWLNREGVLVSPRCEARTVFLVEYTVNPAWGDPQGNETEEDLDARESVVDAFLIMRMVQSMYRAFEGDQAGSAEFMRLFQERLGSIRGFQQAGDRWAMDRNYSFRDRNPDRWALPNWDLGPVTR